MSTNVGDKRIRSTAAPAGSRKNTNNGALKTNPNEADASGHILVDKGGVLVLSRADTEVYDWNLLIDSVRESRVGILVGE